MGRFETSVFAAGALGMAGFVIGGLLVEAGYLGVRAYVWLALASLALYVVCLAVGQLGARRVGDEWSSYLRARDGEAEGPRVGMPSRASTPSWRAHTLH